MHKEQTNQERRRFVKRALGIGALVWMTPTILSVSASKGHACLSGYDQSDRRHEENHEPNPKPKHHKGGKR